MVMVQGGFSLAQVESILEDIESSTLIDEKTKALLRHTEKITRNAYKVTQADIDTLREFGFSDEAVLEATILIAAFAMFTRLTDALGAPIENLRVAMGKEATGPSRRSSDAPPNGT